MGASPPVTRPLISVAEASPANKRLQAASVASASSRTVFRECTLTLPHETHLPLALRSGMDRSQMAEERVWVLTESHNRTAVVSCDNRAIGKFRSEVLATQWASARLLARTGRAITDPGHPAHLVLNASHYLRQVWPFVARRPDALPR